MNLKKLQLLCLLCLPFTIFAQDVQSLLAKINSYHDHRPIEKLYVHLDKHTYTAGETIWFKLYDVVGVENLLSNLSNIAYVDLIDPKGDKIQSVKIPVSSGLGIGDISLRDTLIEGTYRVRGYTNWMRNDSSMYFFDQPVNISNGRSDNVITSSTVEGNQYIIRLEDLNKKALEKVTVRYSMEKNGKVVKRGKVTSDENGEIILPFQEEQFGARLSISFDNANKNSVEKIFKLPAGIAQKNSVQFFAEGGNFLLGGLNNLAVKSLRPDGKGIKSKTLILTEKSDTAAMVETNELGMGASMLYIDHEGPLRTKTTFDDGTIVESELPKVVASGYNMVVNNAGATKLFAQVNLTEDKRTNQDIYFLVQYLGRVYYVSKQKASKREIAFVAQKADLPSGILTITILDHNMVPVVERPVFLYKEESRLPLSGQTEGSVYGARKKVTVQLETGKATDTVRNAALSASVVDLSTVGGMPNLMGNIYSSLFLQADIKGYIEKPGFYFDGEVKVKDIDYLLLTQGWRKIDVQGSLDTAAPAFAPEKGITIAGQTRKLGRKAPFPNAKVTLVSTKNFMDFIDTTSNENGDFVFDELFFPDSVKFLVTAKDTKGKNNIDIVVPGETAPIVGANRNSPDELNNVNQFLAADLTRSKQYFAGLESQGLMEKSIAIESVTVTARAPRKKASENSSNLNGPGNADQVITAEELETCATLEMCLQGRLMGVMFQNGVPHTTRGGGEMQVVLDGMYIEGDQLSMINPVDVQSVEVLRNASYTAIYGMHGGNGLIIITSKTGKDAMRNYVPKGILTVQPKGLHLNKTFYKPVYEVDSDKKLNQDLRSTIHWEPNIITDQAGNGKFDFYTADRPGKYLITVEGIDFMGRVGRKTIEIEVK